LKKLLLVTGLALTGLLAITVPALAATADPISAAAGPASAPARNFGYYDNQAIEYEAAMAGTFSSPQEALSHSHGLIVFHIVDANGNVPAVQLARAQAAFPSDVGFGNVLNFIPTDIGYTGGSWSLQIFHWNPGVTPTELSRDTDIQAAVAAGLGTLEITSTLVRCPVVNFSNLR